LLLDFLGEVGSSSERRCERLEESRKNLESQKFIKNVDGLVRSIINISMSLGGDPYFSGVYNHGNKPQNTKFEPGQNPRYDFKNWVYENFPFLVAVNYPSDNTNILKARAEEIQDAGKTLDRVEKERGSRFSGRYVSRWEAINKSIADKKFTNLGVLLNMLCRDIMMETLYDR